MKDWISGIFVLALLASSPLHAQLSESKLIPSDGGESEYFGWTVAVLGDYAIIGASEDDDQGPASGSVYIFKRVGTGWIQQQKILASDGASYDTFGNGVALSDSYAVVGAQLDDDRGLNSGSVYVLKLENGNWVETTKLTANDGAEEDHFGSSVAISGDRIVIGASLDDDLGENSGSAYVFNLVDTTWVQEAKLLASDGEIDDRFEEVAISGDYIIVGAWGDQDQGALTGSAYIYLYDGSGWNQQTKLTASDAAGGDQFGLDVAISGDYAIVGAYGNDDNGENSGSAYIYKRDGTTWSEQQKLLAGNGSEFDEFGISVSISDSYAVVGADVTDEEGENSGSAYLFRREDSLWTESLRLTAGDGKPYDFFGISVAVSADHLLIGAGGNDDNGFDAGAAYAFDEYEATSVNESKPIPMDFSLNQNYPNPFNPVTTFTFTIPSSSFAILSIYDLLGREVATVVNEKLAPGVYTREWDATDQPSGVYFYRIQAGNFMETKKMVLVR